jgi:cold shock CspA family protein/ribosome-associated translation inhibitor RaiA
MLLPLQIDYRDVEKIPEIDELIHKKAQQLERICDHINSCRVIVEKVEKHTRTHQGYHVRLDIRVPPGHEIAVSRDGGRSAPYQELDAEVRWAFEIAEKQLQEIVEKQRGDVKKHHYQEVQGVIRWLNIQDSCGFIRTIDGREVYFHRNSVLHNRFESLKPGMGVRFTEEMGDKGPQATSVKIIEVPESL